MLYVYSIKQFASIVTNIDKHACITVLMANKISITFNFYEYGSIKQLRDIWIYSGIYEVENTEIKEVLWILFKYTEYKIMKNRNSLSSFLNMFQRRSNLPLFPEEPDVGENLEFTHLTSESSGEGFLSLNKKENVYNNVLYVLKLSEADVKELDNVRSLIITSSPSLKKPNYAQIFRECLHFVIDKPSRKVELCSVLYAGYIMNFSMSLALESYIERTDLTQFGDSLSGRLPNKKDKEIYEKFKKWLRVNKVPHQGSLATEAYRKFNIGRGPLFNFFIGYLIMRYSANLDSVDIPSIVLSVLFSKEIILNEKFVTSAIEDFIKYLDRFFGLVT